MKLSWPGKVFTIRFIPRNSSKNILLLEAISFGKNLGAVFPLLFRFRP
jgi:hypothetical protein